MDRIKLGYAPTRRSIFSAPDAVIRAAEQAKVVVTAEEHAPFGGLGSMVSQIVGEMCPRRVINITLPDAPVITGTSQEVFDYYGMNADGIAKTVREALKC